MANHKYTWSDVLYLLKHQLICRLLTILIYLCPKDDNSEALATAMLHFVKELQLHFFHKFQNPWYHVQKSDIRKPD